MKQARKSLLASFLCLIVFATYFTNYIFAYNRKDHDQYMLEVLFKNFKEIDNDPTVAEKIEALECASYLCIDQFNSNGQKDLDILISFGVKDIPYKVEDISFNASGATHRSYTHRGWDYPYFDLWPKRKQLLISTVDKIFDFEGNLRQEESFCAIIYYIHILGDHMDDTSYKVSNGLKMDAGGRKDKADIIHEMKKHIDVVFSDQKHTYKYQSLMVALDKYNSRLYKLVNSEGGINTDEKFDQKKTCLEGLKKMLTMYLPEMLKTEMFFYDAFYK